MMNDGWIESDGIFDFCFDGITVISTDGAVDGVNDFTPDGSKEFVIEGACEVDGTADGRMHGPTSVHASFHHNISTGASNVLSATLQYGTYFDLDTLSL